MSLLPERGRDLILAGAIISILLNPVLFAAVDRYLAKGKTAEPASGPDTPERAAETATREPIPPTTLSDHVVLVGYGRVGRVVTGGVQARRMPLLLIEENKQSAAEAMNAGAQVISGTATDREVLAAANLAGARCLLVAIPDAFEGGQVVAQARAINPSLYIIARSHSDEETEHLKKHGASKVIMGEHETARAMLGDLPPRTR
jgi:CPA2 family monovalent cation:H+ antiporter-2